MWRVFDFLIWVLFVALFAGFGFCLFMFVKEAMTDRGQCLATERYSYLLPINTGNINGVPIYTYIPAEGTRCARWEFPEGRPAS